ncbi:MAG: endonuclease/exonuclease/phosphatase family protein [Proteobacteria bacterium]|nr:endonuclease/exonuclease/phosphatase family protein [Pseudomonadota bacterium]
MTSIIHALTYNIHKGFTPANIRFRLPKMCEAIAEVDSDIVFLQEVQGAHKRKEKRIEDWPDPNQFEYLAKELGPHYVYGKNAIYQSGHHGNAILSKYPFAASENISLSHVTRASRGLLHGIITIPEFNKPIHSICIHLGLFKTERQEQLIALSERIALSVPQNEPLIIAGDFNDWREVASEHLEQELGLSEVFKTMDGEHAKTFPAWSPKLPTDRIYFRGLNLVDGKCLKQKHWKTLSDHLPLHATFSLLPEA